MMFFKWLSEFCHLETMFPLAVCIWPLVFSWTTWRAVPSVQNSSQKGLAPSSNKTQEIWADDQQISALLQIASIFVAEQHYERVFLEIAATQAEQSGQVASLRYWECIFFCTVNLHWSSWLSTVFKMMGVATTVSVGRVYWILRIKNGSE